MSNLKAIQEFSAELLKNGLSGNMTLVLEKDAYTRLLLEAVALMNFRDSQFDKNLSEIKDFQFYTATGRFTVKLDE